MTNLALLTIVGFVLFMSRGIVGPVTSLYAQDMGASLVLLSALGTTTSVFSVFLSYTWGRSSDVKGGRKAFMLIGLGLLAVEALFTAMIPVVSPGLGIARPYLLLFPTRLIGAVGQTAYSTANLAMLGDLLETRASGRGARMGLVRGSSSLGFGLMAFGAGKLSDMFAINVPFYISAGLLAIAFLLTLRLQEERFVGARRLGRFDWHSAWQSFATRISDAWSVISGHDVTLEGEAATKGPRLPLAPLLIASFLFSLMMGSVYGVWANYMKHEVGFSTTLVSVLWATASTSEFPWMIFTGWLSDRLGRLPMMSLGFLVWALIFVGYVFTPQMPWIVVIQLVRGFAFSAVTASAMTYAAEARGRSQRGQVSGLYDAMGGVGSIVGAAIGGTLAQWRGFHFMFAIAAIAMLAGAVYFASSHWRSRRAAMATE